MFKLRVRRTENLKLLTRLRMNAVEVVAEVVEEETKSCDFSGMICFSLIRFTTYSSCR
jgi:hypothetical protein